MNKLYETTDFYLAVYLKYKGFDITRIRNNGGNQSSFVFNKTEQDLKTNPILIDFYNRNTFVEPLQFVDVMRDLKSMMRNV